MQKKEYIKNQFILEHVDYDIELKRYETKEEKQKLEKMAITYFLYLYEGLKQGLVYNYPIFIESITTCEKRIAIVYEEYETKKKRIEEEVVVTRIINPYFKALFSEKLRELAKTFLTHIEVNYFYDEEIQTWFCNATIYSKEAFYNKFGIELGDYYKLEKSLKSMK